MSLGQNRLVYDSNKASPEISGVSGSSPVILLLNECELEKKPNTKRCNTCSKKTGLTGFTCRCGLLFCGQHRYPDEHKCTYDYMANDKKILEKTLVIGKLSQKLEKI